MLRKLYTFKRQENHISKSGYALGGTGKQRDISNNKSSDSDDVKNNLSLPTNVFLIIFACVVISFP